MLNVDLNPVSAKDICHILAAATFNVNASCALYHSAVRYSALQWTILYILQNILYSSRSPCYAVKNSAVINCIVQHCITHSRVYNVQCIVYSSQCILYSVQSIVYNVQCTL